MLKYILGLLTLGLVVAGCSTYTHSDDCNALQGKWHVVSAKEDGAAVTPARLNELGQKTYTVNVHELTPCCPCANCNGTADIVLDPTASPKEMTLVCSGCSCCGCGSHVNKGTYTVDGDTFVFSWNNSDDRPADAASAKNSYVFKRGAANGLTAPAAVCTCKASGDCAKCPACSKGDRSECPCCHCNVCNNGATCATCAAGKAATCDKCKKTVPAASLAPAVMVNPEDESQKAAADAGKKFVVPTNNWRNGVLTVFYPNTNYTQVDSAAKKAIPELKDKLSDETSIKNKYSDGSIIFGKAPDNTLYNCTLAPAQGFTIVRIHYGDWGNLEESYKIANKIADNL